MTLSRNKVLAPLAALLIAALALLAGCGSSGSEDKGGESSAATRTVKDAAGNEVQVPEDPQKVVSLHYAATQSVYDLGVNLVGQGIFEEGAMTKEIQDKIGDVPVVTTQDEVQVEKVAQLEPDLILAPNTTSDDVLKQLREIGPVYVWTLRGDDRANWEQRVEEVADATNKTDKYKELKDQFSKRQQDMASQYKDVISGKSVGVVDAFEDNNFYAWGEKNMTGTLLTPLGFTWSKDENAAVKDEKEPEKDVSNEKIGSVLGDADVIFHVSTEQGKTTAPVEALMKTSLYKNLKAVKAGNNFPIGKTTIAGFSDANYSLDQIEAGLKKMK
ncbi:ABC transporter substrate-binding protein [Brevibacterium sp. 5221]|uniref:ABC transporter substrate-binding protein n=1 Tax=Brevibacterium rongguiense TaxID=2695267 RepID=A0A6N9H6T2_9MICO|nr:ABC transporter substrate-binding protein [Brevibacterium rongguiense]MYM19663.1 ABC transporter substrate-binding protein [Brevibacterium rongguiense]